ncbi:MAG: hypothetical protein JO279_01020 [Verrucomicrobia bacterium]|nr:hypothetical protein [Verrucomicrobiota bacterium]
MLRNTMLGLDNVSWILTARFPRKTGCIGTCFFFVAALYATQRGSAQWVPHGTLRNVPVRADCHMTRHGVGVSLQATLFYPYGAIFLCPEREREIDARRPGAARFFLVHEYGHLAMRSREEAVADEWAAKQLSMVPAERGTLRAVIAYFVDEGTLFDPAYGTGFDRALRVARAAGIAEKEWPLPLVAYAKDEEIKRAEETTLRLRLNDPYNNAAQMIIWIDGRPIGVLSNVDGERPLQVPNLTPGQHLIQADQVWIYHTEPSGLKSEVARRRQAECELASTGKKLVVLELRYDGSDGDTLSIGAAEANF